jgi:hypothetical protein
LSRPLGHGRAAPADLDAAGFAELPEKLRHHPEAGQPQPDEVAYAIRADGPTFRALGSAHPPELSPLIEALSVVLHRDASGSEMQRWSIQ